MTVRAGLLKYELNQIFHLHAQLQINKKRFFNPLVETVGMYITENEDLASANSLTDDIILSGKLNRAKKNNGPKTGPLDILVLTRNHSGDWPLRITHWNLSYRQL